MGLGLVCHHVTLVRGKPVNSLSPRALRVCDLRSCKLTSDQILAVWHENIASHRGLPAKLMACGASTYRISSSLLPLWDLVDDSVKHDESIRAALTQIGSELAGIRCVMHPGQFVSLSSQDPRIQASSLGDLAMHAYILDCMGFPRSPHAAINIHGGSKAGLFDTIDAINRLPESIKSRITLENDELCFATEHLLFAHSETGCPIVFDSHHHSLNPGRLSTQAAYDVAVSTWPAGIRPLQHISSSRPESVGGTVSQLRAHGDYITHIYECQAAGVVSNSIDLEIEAKAKNFAVARVRDNLFPGA